MSAISPGRARELYGQYVETLDLPPSGVRWDDWTDAHRDAHARKDIARGVTGGYIALRMSQAAERLVEAAVEGEGFGPLVEGLVAECREKGYPCAEGFAWSLLNDRARRRHQPTEDCTGDPIGPPCVECGSRLCACEHAYGHDCEVFA